MNQQGLSNHRIPLSSLEAIRVISNAVVVGRKFVLNSPDYKALFLRAEAERRQAEELRRQTEEQERHEEELQRQTEERGAREAV
ncbi:hypothetical protein AJ78_08620 [Emergomyces pasteurianus Ep9510]|uniref:Uncharacterized protein n=1 Tax=Emergomyces pasteurianus Ep9510 TaxID=1447872 RepID=A0A1J9P1V0_9EURO|nr:hypothetical protein AJ78_08620 [Emergomyces pasteurianus Ep9510]